MTKKSVLQKTMLAGCLYATTVAGSIALADTLIYAGQLIDGTGTAAQSNVTVRIQDNRITAVHSGFVDASDDDTVVDYRDGTVMPGFIDLHTHITSQRSPTSYLEAYQLSPADYAYRSVKYAKVTLDAGFTTIRNLGDSASLSVSLREAIQRGYVQGPRIFTSGKSLATTGGHADPSNSDRRAHRSVSGPEDGVINGPMEARQAVRARYQEGADLIKITATGGVLSLASSGDNPQFMMDELEAIVKTAEDYGMKVAAHAHGKDGMIRAIKAGVVSIEHGTYMDEEVFELMKYHGTWYVPTISAGHAVSEDAKKEGVLPEVVREKAATIGPLIQSTLADAYAAGVKIAFGTDAGVFPHGENGYEFVLMHEAGVPVDVAIRSATGDAAKVLGRENELGTIAEGMLADIVAVRGNPLDDVHLLTNPAFVMKDGQVYKNK